uniref:Uncharacterized protein n=1 Tax=candidate division WOR-3 bacterium TaxID=2052148 RepID=A0A7V3ZVG5_UNCW3
MLFLLILFNYSEVGFLLGDITPLFRLQRYYYPAPSFGIFLSKEIKKIDLSLSFSYSKLNNQYSSLYFLEPKIELEPNFLKIKDKKLNFLLALAYLSFIRKINLKEEKGDYLGYSLGFSYKEKSKKVIFLLKISLTIIPERLNWQEKINYYYFLSPKIGVGYEF